MRLVWKSPLADLKGGAKTYIPDEVPAAMLRRCVVIGVPRLWEVTKSFNDREGFKSLVFYRVGQAALLLVIVVDRGNHTTFCLDQHFSLPSD